jgi:hypothetical protein
MDLKPHRSSGAVRMAALISVNAANNSKVCTGRSSVIGPIFDPLPIFADPPTHSNKKTFVTVRSSLKADSGWKTDDDGRPQEKWAEPLISKREIVQSRYVLRQIERQRQRRLVEADHVPDWARSGFGFGITDPKNDVMAPAKRRYNREHPLLL